MAMALSVNPISSECSDVDLVAAVRRGSNAAFEELYARYADRIGAYVRGMVQDSGRAEDVTQEIFISALRRIRETERPIAFKPWIFEIAKNACIDNFRRAQRSQEVSLDADDGLSLADRRRLTVITTPDAALDSKQALEDLRGAFGGLSPSHHEILVLRELEGRSYSDIAERLGMSRPVVESTLFRARRRLAEEYEELSSGRRCVFVHNMISSGPHFSLGIRDRRRIARHLAHCQSCRAHARAAGFEEPSLGGARVAARVAALLPIPLLTARWGGAAGGAHRGRASLFAWRALHSLARPSEAVAVAGPVTGRGAATVAAIVLAGVGGGVATVTATSASPPRASGYAAAPARATPVVLRVDGRAVRINLGVKGWAAWAGVEHAATAPRLRWSSAPPAPSSSSTPATARTSAGSGSPLPGSTSAGGPGAAQSTTGGDGGAAPTGAAGDGSGGGGSGGGSGGGDGSGSGGQTTDSGSGSTGGRDGGTKTQTGSAGGGSKGTGGGTGTTGTGSGSPPAGPTSGSGSTGAGGAGSGGGSGGSGAGGSGTPTTKGTPVPPGATNGQAGVHSNGGPITGDMNGQANGLTKGNGGS